MSKSPSNCIDMTVIDALREFQEDGKPDLVTELFELFVMITPRHLKNIDDALAKNDVTAISRSAHTLKSQCGNLGARKMVELCFQLEDACRDPKPDMDRIRKICEDLQTEYNRVTQELQTVVKPTTDA